MKRSCAFISIFVLAILCAPIAQAQDYIRNDGGLYWGVRGGLSQVRHAVSWDWGALDPIYQDVLMPDGSILKLLMIEGINSHTEYRDLEMDYGFVAGATIGYTMLFPGYPAALRFEAEGIYRRNDNGEINSEWFATSDNPDSKSLGHVTAPVIGSLEVMSVMGNVLMEFNTPTRFSPYVGVGAGMSQLNAVGFIYDTNRENWLGNPQIFSDQIYALSWQAIFGVGYKLSPGTMLTVESRYFRLATDRWSELFFREELQNVKFDDWSVGLRYTF